MPCLLTHVFPVSPSRRYSSWGQGFRLSHVPPSAPGIGRALNKPVFLMNTAASHDKGNERNTADAMENYSRKTSFRWGMQGRPPWGPGIYVDGYAGIDRKMEEEGVVQSEQPRACGLRRKGACWVQWTDWQTRMSVAQGAREGTVVWARSGEVSLGGRESVWTLGSHWRNLKV